MRTEAKRHKMGHTTGDMCKKALIRLREQPCNVEPKTKYDFEINHCKAWRRDLKEHSKSQQRQLDKKEVKKGVDGTWLG